MAIFVTNGDESQAKSVAAFNVTNDSIGVYSAFLNQKIEFGGHALFHAQVRRLDEQAVDTNVQDTGYIIPGVAPPADPDVL